jgi:hypothetical protein
MGCDYYIVKEIEITYNTGEMDIIEVDRKGEYVFEDPSDSEEDRNEYFDRKYLQVRYIPRILFVNGEWSSERIRDKYEKYIQNKPLLMVVKKERRYKRL